MAEKSACLHQDLQYRYEKTVLMDTNVIVLQISASCNVCKCKFRAVGVRHSNVLKEYPFTHDDGLTISIPLVPVGETVIETASMEPSFQPQKH